MRRFIDKLYFFAVICANASTLSTVLGGHATLRAGGTASAVSSGQSDPVLLAINLVIGGLTLLLAFSRFPQIVFMLGSVRWLAGLYAMSALSILWSESRGSTFRGSVYLIVYLVSAAYLALRFEHEELFALLGKSIAILAVLSIPAQFILPHDSYSPVGWAGIFQHKNELGSAMAVGVVALVMTSGSWNLLRISSLGVCSALLVLSQSTTSFFAVAAALGVGKYVQMSRRARVPVLILILGLAVASTIAISSFSDVFTETTGKDLTFTGRTEVWAVVLQQIAQRPLLGYGNGAFWLVNADAMNTMLYWHPGQSHNSYLEICLDLGIAGLLLIVLLLVDALRRAGRVRRVYGDFAGVSMLSLAVLTVVHSFAEADFLRMHIIWFVFLIVYLSAWTREYALASEPITETIALEQEHSAA